MLITLNQLKASLVAFKDWVLARIPTKTSDLTNDSNFVTTADIPTKVSDLVDDSGHYTKPSGGIPASDLASGVIPTVPVQDVQTNGTSVLNNGIANVPIASTTILGVVKNNGEGIVVDSNTGDLYTQKANPEDVKTGTNRYKVIVPQNQNEATFYGLAKAAGDSTQSASSNPVGTYTDDAKASIKTMLGVEDPVDVQINGTSIVNNGVANIPVASASTAGVMSASSAFGIGLNVQGGAYISGASSKEIKTGTSAYKPITAYGQHEATFYGLAKAAGDATQSASSNAVGTYTDEAKSAIQTMLGVDTVISEYDSEIKDYIDARSAAGSTIVSVSGTTPTIAADAGSVYVCGELTSLTFTPPNTGVTTVVFTSGSTATELTLPSTVKMPDWFVMEANRVYEISISLGSYGTVMSWAV